MTAGVSFCSALRYVSLVKMGMRHSSTWDSLTKSFPPLFRQIAIRVPGMLHSALYTGRTPFRSVWM